MPVNVNASSEQAAAKFQGATLEDGHLVAGPMDFPLLADVGVDPLLIEVKEARIEADITEAADGSGLILSNGTISGYLLTEQLGGLINAIGDYLCPCFNLGDAQMVGDNLDGSLSCTDAYESLKEEENSATCIVGVDSNDCVDAMDPLAISPACGVGMNLFEPVDDSNEDNINDALTMGAGFHAVSVSSVGMGENKVSTEGCGGCASGPLNPLNTATHVLLFLLEIGYIKRRFAVN